MKESQKRATWRKTIQREGKKTLLTSLERENIHNYKITTVNYFQEIK